MLPFPTISSVCRFLFAAVSNSLQISSRYLRVIAVSVHHLSANARGFFLCILYSPQDRGSNPKHPLSTYPLHPHPNHRSSLSCLFLPALRLPNRSHRSFLPFLSALQNQYSPIHSVRSLALLLPLHDSSVILLCLFLLLSTQIRSFVLHASTDFAFLNARLRISRPAFLSLFLLGA